MNYSRMSPQDIPNFWLRQVGIKLWVTCSSYSLIQEQFRSIKPSSVTSAKVILRKILHWFRYLQGDNNNQHCIIINIDGWSYKSLRVVLNITLPTKTRYIHIFKHTISLGNESLGDESLGKKEKKQFWINSISFQISQIFIIYINTCYVFKNVQIKWDTEANTLSLQGRIWSILLIKLMNWMRISLSWQKSGRRLCHFSTDYENTTWLFGV